MKITEGITKSNASETMNFVLAVPGYLTLSESDYKIGDLIDGGSNATASTYRGVLSETM